jgi:hypothetical protein
VDDASYKLVIYSDADELVREVNEHLAKGWVPQGGLTVDERSAPSSAFIQALLKVRRTSMNTKDSSWINRNTSGVTKNKALSASDSGIVQNVTADAVVVNLPAVSPTTVGLTYTIRNGARKDGEILVTVRPNPSDQIIGNGFTPADNKDVVNPKSTSKAGDEITVVSNGKAGWFVSNVVGTWARQA